MKTIEIVGYKRANLGKTEAKSLRAEGQVPCVIYGGEEQIHFSAPAILFRELVYTAEAHFVKVNVEGTEYGCIMQDIQFHPVSEMILHVDFLQWFAGKPIKMDIPVHLTGVSKGVSNGGTLIHKRRLLTIKALPKNMPEHIDLDITALDFGKAIKVSDVITDNFEILDTPQASIAVVEVPRALRGKSIDDEGEEEGVEGAEEGAGGEEAPAAAE
ncbi:LSU ribosomal protein L25P [Reichenbachiella faecimaris]|uniref:Large ribosomal subunit protein bL25 n=1 Tax=Reichenbachiella faecimaris TaxID=692418 RepID=A0A1W2G918_REIFA|nr:50S ribosomal protein L25/general stress protein Ctc [Reichenbachiella faecimaris]SMD32942.1 LSU ribosomal protein L25P [Reichenbachiella faecimaris]